MRQRGCAAAFVIDADGRYSGTLGMARAEAAENGERAGALATNQTAVSPDTLVEAVIHHTADVDTMVAVVDDEKRLVGSVDRTAILQALGPRD